MRNLTFATLIYISAPTYLFLYFWLKPEFAFVSILSLTAALILAIRNLNGQLAGSEKVNLLPILGSSILLALVICGFSEFGTFPYQSYDYLAHNYKFNLLATQQLPLYDDQRQVYMCYYLGNYIIPALIGKVLSLKVIKFSFYLWCAIGLALAYTWIQIKLIYLSHMKRILICIALLIGSYVCIVFPLLDHLISWLPIENNNSISINGKFILNQVPVFTRNLSESPQHTLPSILGICFWLAVADKVAYFKSLAYFLFATLFLTPFAAIGLLSFFALTCIRHMQAHGKSFLASSAGFGIILAPAYLPVILFLTSSEATSMESNRALWHTGAGYWFLYYLVYLLGTYGVWFLFFGKKLFQFDRNALIVSVVFASLISLFQIGYYNDLNIRSSVVPQMVFGLSIAYIVVTHATQLFKNGLLTLGILFWVLNGIGPFKFYYDRLFVYEGSRNTIENPLPKTGSSSYYNLLESAYRGNGKEVVKQYSLKKGSFFERYLLARRD